MVRGGLNNKVCEKSTGVQMGEVRAKPREGDSILGGVGSTIGVSPVIWAIQGAEAKKHPLVEDKGLRIYNVVNKGGMTGEAGLILEKNTAQGMNFTRGGITPSQVDWTGLLDCGVSEVKTEWARTKGNTEGEKHSKLQQEASRVPLRDCTNVVENDRGGKRHQSYDRY